MAFPKGHKINIGKICSIETRNLISKANSKPKLEKCCLQCKKIFFVIPSQSSKKYCVKKCANLSQIGIPTWNKGKAHMSGIPKPWASRPGEKNHKWSGNNVKYRALHSWVERCLGKAARCESCKLDSIPTGMKRYFQWANISGSYWRDLSDWVQLCVSCHKKFDSRSLITTP